jgi:hypothetical protein
MKIQSVLNQALPIELDQGKTWYQEAHDYAVELSEQFGVDLNKVAGIISAMSPLKEWNLNKRLAKQFLEGKRNLHTRLQVKKAEWILEGKDIELCLGGLKTINFFHNILSPDNKAFVTVDGHIHWMYKEYPSLTPKKYNLIKNDFINYSNQTDQVGCEVQACAWLVVKRIKRDS